MAPAFAPSADLAVDKPAGTPCRHLAADSGCGIHAQPRERGFPGCTVFDCFGAGQQITQVTFGGRSWRKSPEPAGAYLIGVDLRGVDLVTADLLGDLRAADVRGADLSSCLFLTQPQVSAAIRCRPRSGTRPRGSRRRCAARRTGSRQLARRPAWAGRTAGRDGA